MTIGIYQIQNKINGKIYIGQSINIEKRLKQHLRDLRTSQHYNSHFQNAFNKYGENAFKANIISVCQIKQLDYYETWFISITGATNPKYGYNNEMGGNKNKIISKATRKKLSKNHSGMSGKKHSKESKQKMSDSQKKKNNNSIGIFRVYKQKNKTCKQKFRWGYVYTINGKRKHITSVDLYQLKKKVLSENLEWFVTDKKKLKEICKKYNYNIEKLK